MKPKLLLIDDDEAIRSQMKWALSDSYELTPAADRPEALRLLREVKPDVVLLDLGLPPQQNDTAEGLAALGEILQIDPSIKVIILSGQSEKESAMAAVAAGAYDFFPKPVQLDELKLLLRRCVHLVNLEREYTALQQATRQQGFEDMLGASSEMQGVFSFIRKVATADAPVLLLGESGTGKEMAALAIHRRSGRKDGPFVAINCNAIPENLLESELFGHEKGSFTGAHAQRKGLVENANGGTLFLDEIGELPPSIQVKLLRFLQEQRFQRVGGRQEIVGDARVITATNADLSALVKEGTFREDLYFRLAVLIIKLPPLRNRDGDAVLLAREFLHRYAVESGRSGLSYTPGALRGLQSHHWPGNVRELQNRVKRAVIMSEGKRISEHDLELTGASGGNALTLREARESAERELVEQTLKRHRGRISAAAAELGVSRPTLYELMDKLGVGRRDGADPGSKKHKPAPQSSATRD